MEIWKYFKRNYYENTSLYSWDAVKAWLEENLYPQDEYIG